MDWGLVFAVDIEAGALATGLGSCCIEPAAGGG